MIKKKWNSLTHHSGKPRLGPMSTEKLEEMLKTCRPRHKNKITNELAKRSKQMHAGVAQLVVAPAL